jgi:predicted HicB family RNase H-like nuclease
MMEYKGYIAGPIDFDAEDKTFSGTVAGLRDVIHFEGGTAAELTRASARASTAIWSFAPRPGSSPIGRSTERFWCARNRNCTAKQPCAQRWKA